MSNFSINWPPGVQSAMQTALDSIMNNIEGRDCILYFPGLPMSTTNIIGTPPGDISQSVWSVGSPQPIHSQQGLAGGYGDGLNYMMMETTGIVTMVIYQNPAMFNQVYPVGQRKEAGQIMTRGYVTDLQKILNCTKMQTYLTVGNNIYDFKLAGEPVMPSKIISDRYFYALWSRV